MSKIRKFNEFIDNDELMIKQLIEKSEFTNKSDLESIAQMDSYRKIVELGKKVIPYLLERIDQSGPIWDIALKEITGDGLDSLTHNTSKRMEYWKNWAVENGYQK